jgi:hypothetical protein
MCPICSERLTKWPQRLVRWRQRRRQQRLRRPKRKILMELVLVELPSGCLMRCDNTFVVRRCLSYLQVSSRDVTLTLSPSSRSHISAYLSMREQSLPRRVPSGLPT